MTGGRILAKGGPIAALIALVLGGIYGGAFTPVEAGAMGALALGLIKRTLTLADLCAC